MTADCCGATDDPTPGLCQDCSVELCSSCAGWFDVDGGYGEGGATVRVFARCKQCEAERLAQPKGEGRSMPDYVYVALDNIVGLNAQMADYCDPSECDADSSCIWCEGRAALASRPTKAPDVNAEMLADLMRVAEMLSARDSSPDRSKVQAARAVLLQIIARAQKGGSK